MKKIFLLIALLFFTCLSFAQTRNLKLVKAPTEKLTGEKRKAVVIGMNNYSGANRLDNTVNDANDMEAVFTQLGLKLPRFLTKITVT